MKDEQKLIKQTTQDLLEKLGLAKLDVEVSSGEEDTVEVRIEATPEDSGMLIGFHGETLSALELVISQIVYKKLGEWRRIIVDIGDYRQKRQESLKAMAVNASQQVKQNNHAVIMPYLTSSERRFIHLTLADDPDVETFSEGVGRGRRLVISPKEKEGRLQKEKSKMDEKDK
jgi:spoIIIJ-associated protein